MAGERFFKGEEQILYRVLAGVDIPIACITSNGFTESVEMLETTTSDNAGWKTSRPLNQSYTISFSGIQILSPGTLPSLHSYDALLNTKRSRDIIQWKIVTPTMLVYTGVGYITELSEEAPAGGLLTFSGTIEGYGEPIRS